MKNPSTLTQKMLFVFLPFSAGYFLSYVYRSTNAILAPYLNQDLGINAEQLGLITSVYFLTFALFQLPLGILLDKYGARKVQTVLFIIASLGASLFALGDTVFSLTIGRGLIGLGVSGALMGAFKAMSIWFPKERLSLLVALFLAVGGLGAISASTPLEYALQITDWRTIYFALSITTLIVGFFIFIVVPEKKINTEKEEPVLKVLKIIYTNYHFWRAGPLAGLVGGTTMAIQGLWAGPWLADVGNFSQIEIAEILFLFTISMTIGIIFMGVISDNLRQQNISTISVMAGMIIILIIPTTIITFGLLPKAIWPWILFSLISFCATLSYSGLSDYFPLHYAGRVSTAVNLITFMVAFIAQYAIGAIMQFIEPGKVSGYSLFSYQVSFGVFLGSIVILLFNYFFMTYFSQTKDNVSDTSKV